MGFATQILPWIAPEYTKNLFSTASELGLTEDGTRIPKNTNQPKRHIKEYKEGLGLNLEELRVPGALLTPQNHLNLVYKAQETSQVGNNLIIIKRAIRRFLMATGIFITKNKSKVKL